MSLSVDIGRSLGQLPKRRVGRLHGSQTFIQLHELYTSDTHNTFIHYNKKKKKTKKEGKKNVMPKLGFA